MPSTILIVDDTPANLSVLVDSLAGIGYYLLVAEDGEDALIQAAHTNPDLILLDAMMPGLDGFETCRRLKAAEATRDIPVIFMTALNDTADKVRAFSAGAVDYVTKPFQHEEVLSRVQTHLDLRRLRRQLEQQLAGTTCATSFASSSSPPKWPSAMAPTPPRPAGCWPTSPAPAGKCATSLTPSST
jgi:DNA-binding response OmpR family regulator